MLCTFSFGCFQIYQNKSTKIIAINFIRTIVPIKYMPKISAVGLFCLYKFEDNQTRTCTTFFRMSKLNEPYFNRQLRSETGPQMMHTIYMMNIINILSYTKITKRIIYSALFNMSKNICIWIHRYLDITIYGCKYPL